MRFFLFSLLSLYGCSHLRSEHQKNLSILQLYTTETTVEFNLVAHRSQSIRVAIQLPSGERISPSKTNTSEFKSSDWIVHHVFFEDLTFHDQKHQLIIHDGLSLVEQREFNLFSNQTEKLSFAAGSCADNRYFDLEKNIWSVIEKNKPEWFFFLGDNLYPNHSEKEITEPTVLWEEYIRSRQTLEIYKWKSLIPTYAVWDDNDYGQKDGGSHYALKETSTQFFNVFFRPHFSVPLIDMGPGIASRLQLRGMHFAFLDNRSFRDVNSQEGEHFGITQEEWFFKDIKTENLPTWIISGDQFFGGYHEFESFEGNHPKKFDQFINQLRDVATPFVFLSGDRHFTELMHFPRAVLGQLSYEFTTSPLHAKTYPNSLARTENPWRVTGADETMSFMLFQTELQESSWKINVRAINDEDKVLFQRDLSLTTERILDFDIEKPQKRRRYRRAKYKRK